jgi:hypothetical protein
MTRIRKSYVLATAPDADNSANRCCVGGLFFMAIGIESNFPNSSDIAKELKLLNRSLTLTEALYYANEIVRHNDNGRFPQAFKTLYSALRATKAI